MQASSSIYVMRKKTKFASSSWVKIVLRDSEAQPLPKIPALSLRAGFHKHYAGVIAEDHSIGEGAHVIENADGRGIRAHYILHQAVQTVFFFRLVHSFADAVAIKNQPRPRV